MSKQKDTIQKSNQKTKEDFAKESSHWMEQQIVQSFTFDIKFEVWTKICGTHCVSTIFARKGSSDYKGEKGFQFFSEIIDIVWI